MSTDLDKAFGEMRALLQQPPDAQRFVQMLLLMEDVPEDILADEWIPYAAQHLATWPDETRCLKTDWDFGFDMCVATDDLIHDLIRHPKPYAALIRSFELTPWDPDLEAADYEAFIRADYLDRLTRLTLGGYAELSTFFEEWPGATHLSGLTHLTFQSMNVGRSGGEALAASEHLAGLKVLVMRECQLDDRGAVPIIRAEHFGSLRHLDLYNNGLRVPTALAIAEATHLDELTYLGLGSSEIENEGACALASAEHLATLEVLDLYNDDELPAWGFGQEGIDAIEQSEVFSEDLDFRFRW